MPSGAGSWTYQYYGNTETGPTSCPGGTGVNQAGNLKSKTHPGGLITESFVYDTTGRIVGSRKNTDPWTCMTYDNRGRPATTSIPAIPGVSSSPARTITYAYGLSPDNPNRWRTIVSGGASAGPTPASASTPVLADYNTSTVETDWMGRQTFYRDGQVNTNYNYDTAGRLSTTVAPSGSGTRTYTYNTASRPKTVSLGATLLATTTYSTIGEVSDIQYGNGTALAQIDRDQQGRTKKV